MNNLEIVFHDIFFERGALPLTITILMVVITIILTIIWDKKELKKRK